MKKALMLLALVLAMLLPCSAAWAESGDLDEILDYTITVDVNDDATLSMAYHIEWKVLDSTTDGPLTWVRVGIPNNHFDSLEAASDTVKDISYDSAGGSYARIDLDRAYHAGEVAVFDFTLVQDYMYEVGRDNQGEAVYELTPGWFNDVEVDSLTVKWNADKVQRIAPAAQQDDGYYTWQTPLGKGKRYKVTVGYPDDAFAFDIDKTIVRGVDSSYSDYSDDYTFTDFIAGIIGLGILAFLCYGTYAVFAGMIRSVASAFDRGSGFTTGKKITRTKVVYRPFCEGCGAARQEGQESCPYCGRSFVESKEVISEEDIPVKEKELRRKDTDGTYAYATEPNTYLHVHVTPIIVHSGGGRHHGSGSSSRGSGGSCACASSCACACACGCACACACAGGGRAGCSTKDFYHTDLKLSQLESVKE